MQEKETIYIYIHPYQHQILLQLLQNHLFLQALTVEDKTTLLMQLLELKICYIFTAILSAIMDEFP